MFWGQIIPSLNKGLLFSLSLIIPSAIFAFLGGVFLAVLRVFGWGWLRKLGDAYTALFRGVPLLLQLYFLYYALPKLAIPLDAIPFLGFEKPVVIMLSSYQAAITGFVLCGAAYHSEHIRAALLSIRQGQVKAAQSLGFTSTQMVLYVIVPQAVRRALPACGNEVIYLIKYSSLAYVLTFIELTGTAKELAARNLRYIEIYLTAGVYYLVMTTLATLLLNWIERKVYIPGFGERR